MVHEQNGGSLLGMRRRMERHRRNEAAAEIRHAVERSQGEETGIWKRIDETIGKRLVFGSGEYLDFCVTIAWR